MKTLWKVLLGILGFCLVLGIVLYFLLRKHTSHTPATPTGCKIDNKCPHNLSCNGECQACSAIYQCPSGFDCENGTCVKNTCDGPCPTGTFCYSGYCAPCTCAGIPCTITLPKSCGSEAGQSCGKIVDGACFEELQLDSSAYYTLEPTVCIDEKNYENLCRPAGIWKSLPVDPKIDSLKFGPNASWEFQINPNFCSKGDSKTPEDCENAQGTWHGPVLSAKIDNNGNIEDSPAAVQLHAKKIVSAINTWYSVNLIRVVALQYSETSKTGICSFSTTLKMDSVPSGTTASFPASQLTISYLQSDIGTEASQMPCNDNAAANYTVTGEGEEFDSYLIGNMGYLTSQSTIPGRPYRCYTEPSPGCGGKKNPFNQLTNKCYCNTCAAGQCATVPECPPDCTFSDWTGWGECKGPEGKEYKVCLGPYGTQTKTRKVTGIENKLGGTCPGITGSPKVGSTATESQACQTDVFDCPQDLCTKAGLFWIDKIPPYQKTGPYISAYCSCCQEQYNSEGYDSTCIMAKNGTTAPCTWYTNCDKDRGDPDGKCGTGSNICWTPKCMIHNNAWCKCCSTRCDKSTCKSTVTVGGETIDIKTCDAPCTGFPVGSSYETNVTCP